MLKSSPFISQVEVVDLPGESQVLFEAETKLPSAAKDIAPAVDAFISAANFGMFSKEPTAKIKPIEVESFETQGQGIIRYLWKVNGVQVGAYRVLINMLEAAHHFSTQLERIRLISIPDQGKRLNWDDFLSTSFPGKAFKPPFLLRYISNLEEPLIRLEFQRDISDDELVTILPPLIAWDNLVIRGGYLEELEDRNADLDIEESLATQQTYLASPNTVEHLYYDFIGQEAAFDALINMAIRLHYLFCPLLSFEIE